MTYDFTGLTESQAHLLTMQGWNLESGFVQPWEKAMVKLIHRGLVIPHENTYRGVKFVEYEVPIPVHIAWCEYCSTRRAVSRQTRSKSA